MLSASSYKYNGTNSLLIFSNDPVEFSSSDDFGTPNDF